MNDLNLACFLSVARTLNFSVSARTLSIPQQSVSRNIQKLEEELGYTLLNRDSQNVSLTHAGKEFYRWCQDLDVRLQTADMTMNRVPTSLGLGWGDWTGCPARMERTIRLFQAQHPTVEIHVTQGSHQEIMNFLDSGLIDLALLPDRCVGSASGMQLIDSGISLPLYVLVGTGNPLRSLHGTGTADAALLATLPQLTPPLMCCPEEETVAVSELFSCDFPHGAVQLVPNVGSSYIGLLSNVGCTITPMNSMLDAQDRLAVLCPAGRSARLTFLRRVGNQNPWCSIFLQLVKEAED